VTSQATEQSKAQRALRVVRRALGITRSPRNGDGKESVMAKANETNTATPPAGSGGIDVQALTQGIVTGVSAAIGEALKPLGEQIGKLGTPQAQKPEEKATAEKPLTMADVTKVVTEALAGQQSSQVNAQKRGEFIAANLGKLPKAYQNQLGQDPAKWPEEAKGIQAQFETDAKGLGVKLEGLGNPAGDGGKTAAQEKVDTSKMPAFERLHRGLEKLQPVTVPATETK
jgi:hypothetical protein